MVLFEEDHAEEVSKALSKGAMKFALDHKKGFGAAIAEGNSFDEAALKAIPGVLRVRIIK